MKNTYLTCLSLGRRYYRHGLPLLVAAALLSTTLVPVGAEGLRARLQHLAGRKEQVQSQIRVIKQKQAGATERLWAAQTRLGQLQNHLSSARTELKATRQDLAKAQAELARLEARRAQHEGDVQSHLLALYRSGQPSYLNVVLQADSFSDFANRGRFIDVVVNQDQYMLQKLCTLADRCDRERDKLQAAEARGTALVGQIASDESEARAKQAEVHQILADANAKRSAAESVLAEMENEESQVQAMLRARAHGSSGGGYAGSYSGSWSGSMLRPAAGRISSPFGMRVHPITGVYKLHTGVDIAAPYGAPVHAAAQGLVISTGWMKAYGQTVVIDHGSGIHTWYCHLSSVSVSEGQLVKRGQMIANVGSTGMSTGPHLHFSVLRNGEFVNPLGF
ncbi:MAG TPA: peptidoglycan DD-metalloendopeptidase family protein [Armatimonadota bacterium]|jgi:murein DD-endopeptidase MepM/ murein hydrolase activator NlpD